MEKAKTLTACEKHRSWEIIYSDFSGMERKTVELVSRELGRYVIRRKGVDALYVLPCYREGKIIAKNAVIIGTYDESSLVKRFVDEKSVSENAFCTKIVANPDNENASFVIITAKEQSGLYYGALAFLQDYISKHAPLHGAGLRMPELIFDNTLTEDSYASSPKIKTRGIFAWGHPINDYRAFIENMAKQKLNQLIIWNDHVPLNAKDVADYAHSFGIELIWGYAWGWVSEGCDYISDISRESLEKIKERAIKEFEDNYRDLGVDGIYFQSFTECAKEYIDGILIAEAVTELVNNVSAVLFERYPELKIQFGLHAMSVKNQLEQISRVDRRVEIVWEDCGEFPFSYIPAVKDEKAFEETLEFTEKIINLRGAEAPTGLVFKGFMTIDWTLSAKEALEYGPLQNGPYILGENSTEVSAHDLNLRKSVWKYFYGEWTQYGKYAQRVAQLAARLTGGNINLCMAGLFDGGIWIPEAICSELFWNPYAEFEEIVCKTFERNDVVVF